MTLHGVIFEHDVHDMIIVERSRRYEVADIIRTIRSGGRENFHPDNSTIQHTADGQRMQTKNGIAMVHCYDSQLN